ncbi:MULTISPECIES: hypothetical protein [Cysteiniphilum]|uniref:Secreted protein n=1 Tax=Cysteiniphilum litorale TaxID=2056700 RepID=A0A8J2Z3S6_9GAMM|nr:MULTISPECIES: hypothetical protein [Cysteiniphilum]WHN66232.1 hypothetical protein NYP54_03110 [Cysteiniphilum sp. QT6929]GGF94740.1 hypothetical protein GCM10010995_09970 [Cysteiniphilum litorale]
MNNTITLSIAITSLLGLSISNTVNASTSTTTQTSAVTADTGGKCAAGKCGTVKRYAEAEITQNPQEKLVYARDGKCGVTGYGLNPDDEVVKAQTRSVGGRCGQ